METKGNILIVDDNEDVLLSLNMLLRPWVKAIRVIRDPERILEFVEHFKPDVILLDMNFRRDAVSGEEGYMWLDRVLKFDPTSVVVFMTAYVNTEKAVRAIKAGAVDFIPKPWDNKKVLEVVHSAIALKRDKMQELEEKNRKKEAMPIVEEPKEQPKAQAREFIGESEKMRQLKESIGRVAMTDANVLITGENGSGKDVVAHELHRLSARSGKKMVSIDLGCIPEALFESELFGYVKGAFTGATGQKVGRIEEADGGTLFLDEIGNLSLAMQQKLLTVIEKRETLRVGASQPKKIDVRIVAATNANLKERVAEGTFREDLLYRLNTIELNVPPLRERGEDVMLLARHFLKVYAQKYKSERTDFTHEEEMMLLKYQWPGNVRQMQHSVERWVIDPCMPLVDSTVKEKETDPMANSLNLEELERIAIRRALEQSNGNMSLAAELLGITRYALYRKIGKHGI